MAKKVICTAPNASDLINGVAFEHTEEGVISKDVLSDDVAAQFEGIPGYTLLDVEPPKPKVDPKPKADPKPKKEAAKEPAAPVVPPADENPAGEGETAPAGDQPPAGDQSPADETKE